MSTKTLSPAECTYRAFGGIRKVARALGAYPGCVSRWRRLGRVPVKHQEKLLAAASEQGLDLTAEDLVRGRKVEA